MRKTFVTACALMCLHVLPAHSQEPAAGTVRPPKTGNIAPYENDWLFKIQQNWHPTQVSDLSCRITVNKDGRLLGLNVVSSSGDKSALREALGVIATTCCEPLPSWFIGETLPFSVELRNMGENHSISVNVIAPKSGPSAQNYPESKYRGWEDYESEQRRRLAKTLALPKSFELEAWVSLTIFPSGLAKGEVKGYSGRTVDPSFVARIEDAIKRTQFEPLPRFHHQNQAPSQPHEFNALNFKDHFREQDEDG